ncbi:MAG TPA: heme exporter protein CcmD [Steroidobacteraceae bacterium]|jgi:heme exporter protein CcmD
MNLTTFLAMGGYAVYVWPCYALAALVVGFNILWARRSLRLAQRDARRRIAMSNSAAAS